MQFGGRNLRSVFSGLREKLGLVGLRCGRGRPDRAAIGVERGPLFAIRVPAQL